IPGVEAWTIRNCSDEESAFRAAARRADWTLVIAPEFDQILETRCRWVVEEGGKLLGPSPDAVRLCADKLALFHFWKYRGVPTPETREWTVADTVSQAGERIVVKPRFGAGGQHTFFLKEDASVIGDAPLQQMLRQPFVEGQSASVAMLIGSSGRFALRSASQVFGEGTECVYLGGRAPLPPPLEERAQRLAIAALEGVPGLLGYVGVDLILGPDGRDWAIEINPRLTTSYIGLRLLADSNLAEAMLRTALGSAP